MPYKPVLTGAIGNRINNTLMTLLIRNHEIGKMADKTDDPQQLKAIIKAQQNNREACIIIISQLLMKNHAKADEYAQKYLPNPK